eukprot:m.73620 g.73620  ORF g.73620 m.73620 type:complete len:884 (+) comp35851_c0_seq9:69-2720(+)
MSASQQESISVETAARAEPKRKEETAARPRRKQQRWRPSSGQHAAIGEKRTGRGKNRAEEKRSKNPMGEAEVSRPSSKDADFRSHHTKPQTRRKPFDGHYHRGGSWARGHGRHEGRAGGRSEVTDEIVEQLRENAYDCMVCCEAVRSDNEVWACGKCCSLFHLKCIRKWAKSPASGLDKDNQDGSGWRCPACQHCHAKIPSQYMCFCGKVRNPRHSSRESGYLCPHSCGEICHKERPGGCSHKCNLMCHPGRCPPCPVMISVHCPCGKKMSRVRCSQASKIGSCGEVCKKMLRCGQHCCTEICHTGQCQSCEVKVKQACNCGKQDKEVSCEYVFAVASGKKFCCGQTCGKILDCDNHTCDELCHDGPCFSCSLLPNKVHSCPCGKTPISTLLATSRTSCLDPIPCCQGICGKELPCGSAGKPVHTCSERCHYGSCPSCKRTSEVRCQCGKIMKEVACSEIREDRPVCCESICNKKKSCKRHRCNQRCCTDADHVCTLLCGKMLRCGIHRCDELCHAGHCPRCWQTSFEELRCHCGIEVIFPPVPCGTSPPVCGQLCCRVHSCEHEVTHFCHNETVCPPCTTLARKMCFGNHEAVWIPCHIVDVACCSKCDQPLPCGEHRCQKNCHKPPCLNEGEPCMQPCMAPRPCGHPCLLPCHVGKPCPVSPCRSKVEISCKCGRRVDSAHCQAGIKNFGRLQSEDLASYMRDLQLGRSVDLNSVASKEQPRMLECDEECAMEQRNMIVSEALGLSDADITGIIQISLTSFLLMKARTEPVLVEKIENELRSIVQKAQKTGRTCTFSFPVMKREHRRIVHELADVYKCEAKSYDPEPKRNVVATATKTSTLPPVSLMTAAKNDKSVKVKVLPVPSQIHACQDHHADLDDQI